MTSDPKQFFSHVSISSSETVLLLRALNHQRHHLHPFLSPGRCTHVTFPHIIPDQKLGFPQPSLMVMTEKSGAVDTKALVYDPLVWLTSALWGPAQIYSYFHTSPSLAQSLHTVHSLLYVFKTVYIINHFHQNTAM